MKFVFPHREEAFLTQALQLALSLLSLPNRLLSLPNRLLSLPK
jgi:hypothetical protein